MECLHRLTFDQKSYMLSVKKFFLVLVNIKEIWVLTDVSDLMYWILTGKNLGSKFSSSLKLGYNEFYSV